MAEGAFAVYILANRHHTVLYVGMTNDLLRRATEHREGKLPGFAAQYQAAKLIYYELHPDAWSAIEREKQLKAGSRRSKVALIESLNSGWRDLYEDLTSE